MVRRGTEDTRSTAAMVARGPVPDALCIGVPTPWTWAACGTTARIRNYAEHIMRVDKIPLNVYRDQVAAKFHPDAYDARSWVRQMKAAGMQYVILTSKHHDGFAIWPSDVEPLQYPRRMRIFSATH